MARGDNGDPDDIRYNRRRDKLRHESRGQGPRRNSGDFTRGTQLVTHEWAMLFGGIRIPFVIWSTVFWLTLSATILLALQRHEFQLVLMRLWALFWLFMGFDPMRFVNLSLPNGSLSSMPIELVTSNFYVQMAWNKAMRCLLGSTVMSLFIAAPIAFWFVGYSRKRGREIMEEAHERGAMLVERDRLLQAIRHHNSKQLAKDVSQLRPRRRVSDVLQLTRTEARKLGIHQPCSIAGIPYPWRLEQSHTMLIGTTGTGKTTQLRSLVSQLRARGQRAVIFDLTGAFVESFYDPATDIILNPTDQRCHPWTIFNDCEIYADFLSAATALIPSHPDDKEPFWQLAARTLFVEICMKLKKDGDCSNAAIAYHLMTAKLRDIHTKLADTVAGPLTAVEAARMAESIRSVFNTNAAALRFLPDPVTGGPAAFSIRDWISRTDDSGAILFITSGYIDLDTTRMLLTLWTNLAVHSQMRLPKTRDLRTWFLFDEVNALHALPAIDQGLQTARNVGGAFVLGIHSFAKLEETYGEKGAINLAGLARTKLILATADYASAEKCAQFIGNRQVRQVDEAYSYGYNNTRDASTLTPRSIVEPLVIPDDIMNLPAMRGFVKFPDGFPAARVELEWKDYPQVAEGFCRVTQMEPTAYKAGAEAANNDESADQGDGGHQVTSDKDAPEETAREGQDEELTATEEANKDGKSEAERAAEAMIVGEVPPDAKQPPSSINTSVHIDFGPTGESKAGSGETDVAPEASQGDKSFSVGSLPTDRGQTEIARIQAREALTDQTLRQLGKDKPEDQSIRESREGAGVAPLHDHKQPGRDNEDKGLDDDWSLGE